jgi:hypothetical protein
MFNKAEAKRAGATPRESGDIALAGLHRLRSALAAAPVFFAQAVATEIKIVE